MARLDLFPAELQVGDLLETADGPARVLEEPMTMHRGWSPFDSFELLIGTRVRRAGDDRPVLLCWPPETTLTIDRDEVV